MSRSDFIQRANAEYIERQWQAWRRDPASVGEDWALFFAGVEFSMPAAGATGAGPHAGGVVALVHAYREFGHEIATLDPLGDNPATHPLLELTNFGLTEAELDTATDGSPFRGEAGGTVRELLAALRETYCGSLGADYMDVSDKAAREWLMERMERSHNRPQLSREQRVSVLGKLLQADAFEQFLHTRYPGQKRFSLEGGASLVPMLDQLIEAAGAAGVDQIVIGMPHRGRLNVLASILKKPLETMFAEFESSFVPEHVQGHGDVKYHLGYSTMHTTASGRELHLDLNFNPSHLEFVNPVVLGSVRARQVTMGDPDGARGLPVLLHGDASFSGEGIVPESLMLAALPHYDTGGTVHVIVNNQVGFTTSPADARPSRHPTDIARAFNAPVLHVNGDDPEAVVHAITLAFQYRMTFRRDVFVDLVCYRRHGHNELDDPTFTQPVMYRKIAAHVPASKRYAERLVGEGVLAAEDVAALQRDLDARLADAHRRARTGEAPNGEAPLGGAWSGLDWAGDDWGADTRVASEVLERIVQTLASRPEGFTPHPKIAKLADDRVAMFQGDRIDWGLGEALAVGSLLLEGRAVRFSGQDTGRGTFSHRHAVLYDFETGARWVPLQHLAEDQGAFEVFDTPLSEAAALGFEYGYTTADPHTLVVWEAQFGDFVNVAQVYIDQFLASAESKWRRMSGLTLLLPHGYEGQGPEHSSARLERFLELCANGNMQVLNPTTPAQLFHALRRQQHRPFRKPLVIMSPKSLLRHKVAVSARRDFTDAVFQTVLDDPAVSDPAAVRTVLLTSGKFYYALAEARAAREARATAIVRVEQIYPFPHRELEATFARHPNARDVRWVQEEPANMGAWRSTRHRIEAVMPAGATLRLVARKASPTPASGWYPMHVEQEKALLERSLDEPAPRAPRAAAAAAAARPSNGGGS